MTAPKPHECDCGVPKGSPIHSLSCPAGRFFPDKSQPLSGAAPAPLASLREFIIEKWKNARDMETLGFKMVVDEIDRRLAAPVGPTCFIKRADEEGVDCTGWELRPENLRGCGREDDGSPSDRHEPSKLDNAGSIPVTPSNTRPAALAGETREEAEPDTRPPLSTGYRWEGNVAVNPQTGDAAPLSAAFAPTAHGWIFRLADIINGLKLPPETVRQLTPAVNEAISELQSRIAQLERERGITRAATEKAMNAWEPLNGNYLIGTVGENFFVSAAEFGKQAIARAETAEAALTQAQAERDEAKKDAGWKSTHEMYRKAWIRELGGWIIPKSHEIDGLVLTTRKRCVNPLLGNCSEPHWMGKPTSDGKALQQTPHPNNSDCREWKADDTEPLTAARASISALMEALEPLITNRNRRANITHEDCDAAARVYEQVKEKI